MTDLEWMNFLDSDHLSAASLKDQAARLHDIVQPLRQALDSKTVRMHMKTQLKWMSKRRGAPVQMPILSGDRVLTSATQYVGNCGGRKFEVKNHRIRYWRVLEVRKSFVHIEDEVTHERKWRHEGQLKLVPRALPADDAVASIPPKRRLHKKTRLA